MKRSFLQSPEWQDIQERMGRRTERISGVLVIRHDLPLGYHYWYAPRPVFNAAALEAVAARAKSSAALFLKVDPLEPLPTASCRSATAHALQPTETVLVDGGRSDAELIAAMHPKTRYNIRLAERHGVGVRRASRPMPTVDFNVFRELLEATARRDGFHSHPAAHYRILIDVKSEEFSNELFVAEANGTAVAAAVVNFYAPSKTATYLHGASARAHRSLMAPHLLHWRIIQESRERGFDTYDFGGIDQERWPGLTRFKQGFGGRRVAFPPAVDVVFRPALYRLYRLQHSLRHRS